MIRTSLQIIITSALVLSIPTTIQAAFTIRYDGVDSNSPSDDADISGSDAGLLLASKFAGNGNSAGISVGNRSPQYVGKIESTFIGSTEADALADTEFFSFTLSLTNPATDRLNLSALSYTFGGSRQNGNAAYSVSVFGQSSVGDFGTGNPVLFQGSRNVTNNVSAGLDLTSGNVDLNGAEFQGLTDITFQIRFAGTGTNNEQDVFVTNVVMTGEVVPVPEPSSALLLLSGLLGFAAYRRRG